MIRKQSALAVSPIVEALNNRGIAVTPKGNNTITELVKWSFGISESQLPDTDDLVGTLVDINSTVVAEGHDGHSALIDQEVDNTSKVLAHQLCFIKEKAKPLLERIYTETMSEIDNTDPLEIDVVEFSLHDLYKTNAFATLMDTYSSHDYRAVRSSVIRDFPKRTEAELFEIATTGSASIDSNVIDIVSTKDVNWIVEVYEKHFVSAAWDTLEYDEKLGQSVCLFRNSLDCADEYLLVFLLARGLVEVPHDTYSGSLAMFRNVLAAKARAAAVALTITLGSYFDSVKTGKLVISYETTKYHTYQVSAGVTVNRELYAKFLDGGGTPEAVMGAALIKNGRPYTLNEFKTRLIECVSAYNRKMKECSAIRESQHSEYVRHTVSNKLKSFIDSGAKLDYPAMANFDVDNAHAWNVKINKLVDNVLPKRWVSEPYVVIREILGASVWAGTNVLDLLTTLDEEMEKYSELEPREAAYRATIRILVRHYLTLLEHERVEV